MGYPINQIEVRSVREVVNGYPAYAVPAFLFLRNLVFESAYAFKLGLEETLKWGEPSYLTAQGSTLRIAWNKTHPEQIGLYFHCKTILVDTFREIYPKRFHFEGNRAMLFELEGDLTVLRTENAKIKHCIGLALTYHKIKNLPLLGAIPY